MERGPDVEGMLARALEDEQAERRGWLDRLDAIEARLGAVEAAVGRWGAVDDDRLAATVARLVEHVTLQGEALAGRLGAATTDLAERLDHLSRETAEALGRDAGDVGDQLARLAAATAELRGEADHQRAAVDRVADELAARPTRDELASSVGEQLRPLADALASLPTAGALREVLDDERVEASRRIEAAVAELAERSSLRVAVDGLREVVDGWAGAADPAELGASIEEVRDAVDRVERNLDAHRALLGDRVRALLAEHTQAVDETLDRRLAGTASAAELARLVGGLRGQVAGRLDEVERRLGEVADRLAELAAAGVAPQAGAPAGGEEGVDEVAPAGGGEQVTERVEQLLVAYLDAFVDRIAEVVAELGGAREEAGAADPADPARRTDPAELADALRRRLRG